MKKKLLIMVIVVVMVLAVISTAFVGCKDNKGDNQEAAKTYTLHDSMGSSPLDFNPHTWETNGDSVVAGYAEMGLVDVTIAEDGVNFKWVYEMADSITDVTKEYFDGNKELDGKKIVTDGKETGRVYRIKLNESAKWANGVAINADTYIESMQLMLDPKRQNYRANSYYKGDTAIMNAKKYFKSENPIYELCVPEPEVEDWELEDCDFSFDLNANKYYINLGVEGTIGYSIATLHDDYGYVKDEVYDAVAELANPYGYVEVNDDSRESVLACVDAACSAFNLSIYNEDKSLNEDILKLWCFYNTGKFSEPYAWENVGIKKVGEYSFDYILESPSTEFYFLVAMTSNWLVYAPLYRQLQDTTGELITTTYGTNAETYMSYGPYKLATFQKDKQLTFTRNDQWYGWSDGKHNGQFQTTDIVIDIIANETTLETMFLAGKLDALGLNNEQLARYRTSQYLLKTDQTYTYRFIFATNKTSLKDLEAKYNAGQEDESKKTNLKILSYKDFRKALSFAIDRSEFAAQATGGFKPAYSLFSSLYYYDIENNSESIYRRTAPAMQAICDLYNVEYGVGKPYATLEEAYNSITGLDVAQAKDLFTAAYNDAKAAGDYTDGQNIVIHCTCSAASELTEDDLAQERLLNKYVDAATKGTPLEGKISFVFQCNDKKRYENVAAGNVEMIRGAWGGAAFYPFSTIRVYTNPDYMGGLKKIHESCGWDPRKVDLELEYDFDGDGTAEKVTHSLADWSNAINDGRKDEAGNYVIEPLEDANAKLFVMSRLEKAVLESYQCIPWATETACSLFGQKLHYATLNYNIMYAYGGIRLMTYNYDDAAWDAYVKSQGGTLQY